jgi:uncharacterized protein
MPSRVETELTIDGANALLADLGSSLAVIVTHPWGMLGGNLHNNVVVAAVLFFQNIGVTTLRFDFCGSQIGRGYAQVAQVESIAQGLVQGKYTSKPAPKYILLIGYSYGSIIAASASKAIASICLGYIAIAPPLSVQDWLVCFAARDHWKRAKEANLPRLFILGSKDNFTKTATLEDWIQQEFASDTGAIIKEADHFFVRREKDVMNVIGQWIMQTYSLDQLTQFKDMEKGEVTASIRLE